jgi:hypothetical protein
MDEESTPPPGLIIQYPIPPHVALTPKRQHQEGISEELDRDDISMGAEDSRQEASCGGMEVKLWQSHTVPELPYSTRSALGNGIISLATYLSVRVES